MPLSFSRLSQLLSAASPAPATGADPLANLPGAAYEAVLGHLPATALAQLATANRAHRALTEPARAQAKLRHEHAPAAAPALPSGHEALSYLRRKYPSAAAAARHRLGDHLGLALAMGPRLGIFFVQEAVRGGVAAGIVGVNFASRVAGGGTLITFAQRCVVMNQLDALEHLERGARGLHHRLRSMRPVPPAKVQARLNKSLARAIAACHWDDVEGLLLNGAAIDGPDARGRIPLEQARAQRAAIGADAGPHASARADEAVAMLAQATVERLAEIVRGAPLEQALAYVKAHPTMLGAPPAAALRAAFTQATVVNLLGVAASLAQVDRLSGAELDALRRGLHPDTSLEAALRAVAHPLAVAAGASNDAWLLAALVGPTRGLDRAQQLVRVLPAAVKAAMRFYLESEAVAHALLAQLGR